MNGKQEHSNVYKVQWMEQCWCSFRHSHTSTMSLILTLNAHQVSTRINELLFMINFFKTSLWGRNGGREEKRKTNTYSTNVTHSINVFLCTEYTLSYQDILIDSLEGLAKACEEYQTSFHAASHLITCIATSTHQVTAFLLYAKATSHASPNIEIAECKYVQL